MFVFAKCHAIRVLRIIDKKKCLTETEIHYFTYILTHFFFFVSLTIRTFQANLQLSLFWVSGVLHSLKIYRSEVRYDVIDVNQKDLKSGAVFVNVPTSLRTCVNLAVSMPTQFSDSF